MATSTSSAAGSASGVTPGSAAGPISIAVAGGDHAGPYAMFDVDRVDGHGARLIGPMLLEVGEEITLRVEGRGKHVEVRARVVSHDVQGHGPATTVVAFVGGGASLAAIIG